jgi:hypothetical protein
MRKSLWSILPGLALAIVTSGCDRAAALARDSIDGLPLLEIEEVQRIGDADDPDVGFSRIVGFDIDRDGNLFVGEATASEIRVYTAAGQLLRRIGRRGDGPGEFSGAPRFGLVGDTLWTISGSGNRLALFDREGGLLSTGLTPGVTVLLPGTAVGTILPRAMRPDGKFLGWFSRISSSRNRPPSNVQPTDRIAWPLVLFDASGVVVDTAGWAGRPPPGMWRPPAEDDIRLDLIQVGDRRVFLPSPPSALPWWLQLMDGYLVISQPMASSSEGGTIAVTRFGLNEDTVYSRTLRYTPEPYESVELDSIAYRAARGEAGGFVPYNPNEPAPIPDNLDEIAGRIRSEMRFPELKRPMGNAWVANDGSLWLNRQDRGDGVARWVLLDVEGFPTAELELPSNVQPLWASGDTFWASVPDALDVPWVVRYRIRGR